jgi:hypothetical protein
VTGRGVGGVREAMNEISVENCSVYVKIVKIGCLNLEN